MLEMASKTEFDVLKQKSMFENKGQNFKYWLQQKKPVEYLNFSLSC